MHLKKGDGRCLWTLYPNPTVMNIPTFPRDFPFYIFLLSTFLAFFVRVSLWCEPTYACVHSGSDMKLHYETNFSLQIPGALTLRILLNSHPHLIPKCIEIQKCWKWRVPNFLKPHTKLAASCHTAPPQLLPPKLVTSGVTTAIW